MSPYGEDQNKPSHIPVRSQLPPWGLEHVEREVGPCVGKNKMEGQKWSQCCQHSYRSLFSVYFFFPFYTHLVVVVHVLMEVTESFMYTYVSRDLSDPQSLTALVESKCRPELGK